MIDEAKGGGAGDFQGEVLETERLLIRPMTEADGELIVAWRNDEETRRMTLSGAALTLEQHLEWFRTSRAHRLDSMVVLKDSGRVIGTVSFKDIHRQPGAAESGRLLGDLAARGKGYARESALAWFGYGFRSLGLRRIIGVTRRTNAPNIRLNKLLGYEVIEDQEGDDFIRMELTYERATMSPDLRKFMGLPAREPANRMGLPADGAES
jgi:RimJ/RimL family protein N-acetyltransferase